MDKNTYEIRFCELISASLENPVTRFPAGRRGPRSGEGVLEGKNRKETQSRAGRLSAVRIAAECHIGAWPRTPYGPSRGNEGGRREIFESYSSCTLPAVPPLVAAPPPFSTGKRLTRFSGRCRSPTNRVRLPPRKRWDNKAPQGISFISCSNVSTGCSATACGVAKELDL
mgnify:CR=1 FL=1